MNTEELRKLLKENGVHFYSYWGKKKLEDLANINKLIPEPEPEPETEPKQKVRKYVSCERMRNIRNSPISVKFIDIETKEEKIFHLFIKHPNF